MLKGLVETETIVMLFKSIFATLFNIVIRNEERSQASCVWTASDSRRNAVALAVILGAL